MSRVRFVFVVLIVIIIALTGTLAAYLSLIQTKPHSSTIISCTGSCYVLSFNQTPVCPNYTSLGDAYFAPWSVTVTNENNNESITKVQPPGSPPPDQTSFQYSGGRGNKQYGIINFTLPTGNYSYTLSPGGSSIGFVVNSTSPTPNRGTVTINAHNTVVNVRFFPASCGALMSWNVSCSIQRVSVFSVVVVSTSHDSIVTYGSTTEETYNVTTIATSTNLTEPAGYEMTTTLTASSTETFSGAITAWTVQSCSWLFP